MIRKNNSESYIAVVHVLLINVIAVRSQQQLKFPYSVLNLLPFMVYVGECVHIFLLKCPNYSLPHPIILIRFRKVFMWSGSQTGK